MKQITSAVLFAAALATLAHGANLPAIQTIPSSGTVSGAPGTVVGWGFDLTFTDPSNWVVLNDSFFTGSTIFGSYVDYLTVPGAPIYVAGPAPESSDVMQAWDPSSAPPLGLGEFDINKTAAPGPITGNIGVDYTIFSTDPNDPNFDPNSFVASGTLFVPVDVQVTATQVTPEPASILLMSGAILPFLLAVGRRPKT